jgi:hypothetical protein
MLVVYGGTKDVGKKEATNGMSQLKEFATENSHTICSNVCSSQT